LSRHNTGDNGVVATWMGVYDDTQMRIYLDGVLDGSVSINDEPSQYNDLYFFEKLEPINCRRLLEPLSCRSGKLMVQVTLFRNTRFNRKTILWCLGYA